MSRLQMRPTLFFSYTNRKKPTPENAVWPASALTMQYQIGLERARILYIKSYNQLGIIQSGL